MTASPLVVVLPGSRWDDIAGTDRQLATALAEKVRVLWVDPGFPLRLPSPEVRGSRLQRLDDVAPGLVRLRFVVPPGASRPGGRTLAAWCRGVAVRRAARRLDGRVLGVVGASPQARFPRRLGRRRLLLVTDDWYAGAQMMGLSRDRIGTVLDHNVRDADVLAGISVGLVDQLRTRAPGRDVELVPNGCPTPTRDVSADGRRGAVLLGQLNERLDLDAVDAVLDAGVPVTVIGPRAEREDATRQRLDALLARPGVTWLGPLPHPQVAAELRKVRLGLTPYLDNAFNRSSFPLKTLEYLSAGLPVVSSDLPMARWLGEGVVELVGNAQEFAARAAEVDAAGWDPSAARLRTEHAARHTWSARADQVLRLLKPSTAGEPAASTRHSSQA